METLRDENIRLQQELQQRDLLVQQLSEEVLRLVKGNVAFLPNQALSEQHEQEMRSLTHKLVNAEEQLILHQLLLKEREQQLSELQNTLASVNATAQSLQQKIDNLPTVYSTKFSERMEPVKSKVEELQKQNTQLNSEVQNLSHLLAHTVPPQRIEVPEIQTAGLSLPTFGDE
jgi:chromosome segregation ATPase